MIKILWEDNDSLVIEKPFGMVVNRADSVSGITVQDWVEDFATGKKDWDLSGKLMEQRVGVCHRIDKETSGCLLIAKNPAALSYYLKLFEKREVNKKYMALAHGRVDPKEGGVILPIRRNTFDREKWGVHYEGKRAVTEWTVRDYYYLPDSPHWKNTLSLLDVVIKTGRTHQIRVHMSFLGWPLFSDERYLNREQAEKDRKSLSHHFLHANTIEFPSFCGERVLVESSLPDDCQDLLSKLERC